MAGPRPDQALQSYHAFRTLGETKSIFLLLVLSLFRLKKSSFLSPMNLPTWSDWVVIGTVPPTTFTLTTSSLPRATLAPPYKGEGCAAPGAQGETAMSAYKRLWLDREQRDHAAARAAERETATPEARDASASEPVVNPNQQPLFVGVSK